MILFFIATLWAGTFPLLKLTFSTAFPPFYFVAIRFLAAAILFTIIFHKKIRVFNKNELKAGLVLGFLLEIGFASQSLGLVYTSASNSTLITGVNVLIVPFAQYLVVRKKVRFENWIGVIIVTSGLFLLTRPLEIGFNPGDISTLFCAVSWAFYILFIDVFTNKYNIYILIFIQFWLITILSFILGLTFENFSNVVMSPLNILSLVYMAVFATLIATTLGNKYQKYTTPVRATLVMMWEQPAAVILSILILNEKLNAIQIIGGVLMITGILFSETFEYVRRLFFKSPVTN